MRQFCPICGNIIQPGSDTYCRQDLVEVHRCCGENIDHEPGLLRDRPGELRRWQTYIRENDLFQAILALDYRSPGYADDVLRIVKGLKK